MAALPKQKSSKIVTLSVVGVVSLMVVGFCAAQNNYEEVGADCVDLDTRNPDGSYVVVDDDYCEEHRYHGSTGAYGWYYAGTRLGTRVVQGTTVRPSNAQITSRTGYVIQRGGFGGRGSSSGG